jgi:phosphopantothenoylcysteine decarboxylase
MTTGSSLKGREILLGVSGGIAAYKSADLTSKLVQAGASVSVVLTRAARKFIGKTTFEALTARPVYGSMFAPKEHFLGEHIGLARRCEVLVVAPATADSLARIAHGHADDLLSTLILTVTGPILLAPSMNAEMWAKAAVQRNLARLREDGFHFVEPGSGWQSCREIGTGRMAEPAEILSSIEGLLGHASRGKDVLH